MPITPVVVSGSLPAGIGLPWTVIAALTAVQRHTPSELTGGVAATADMLVAPVALSIPVGAALAEFAGHRLVLATAVAVALAAAVAATRRPREAAQATWLPGEGSNLDLMPANRQRPTD